MSLFHCYTDYPPRDPEMARRHGLARESWKRQLWAEVPVRDDELPRLWKEEGRAYPYVKDVLDFACRSAGPEDVVVYTNADIHVRSDTSLVIMLAMQGLDACYAFRTDFPKLTSLLPDADFHKGVSYAGSDLIAFRVGWWLCWREDFPDMLLGIEAWDPCFRVLVDQSHPGKQTGLPRILAHERHATFWENAANRYRYGGQKHNLKLARGFLAAHGVNPKIHGIP